MMKKRICLILAVFLCVVLLSGCAGVTIQDDPSVRANVDSFLAAVLAEDENAAYGALCKEIGPEEFHTAYAEIREYLKNVDSYQLTPIQYNYRVNNGTESIALAYRMVTNEGVFVVSAASAEGYEGLVTLYVTPEEQTALTYNGTPGHMQDANTLQWIILVGGILSWVFVLLVCVDCCRRRIKHKILWILLILLAGVIVTLSISGTGLNLNFNVGIYLKISTLIRYGNGTTKLSLVIPAGAVIYLCCRKKLIKKGRLPEPPVEEIPSADLSPEGGSESDA